MKSITVISLLILLTQQFASAQLTYDLLERSFTQNSYLELNQEFNNIIQETDVLRKNNANDTSRIISIIVTQILESEIGTSEKKYCYVQPYPPVITISDSLNLQMTYNIPSIDFNNSLVLRYKQDETNSINRFLGLLPQKDNNWINNLFRREKTSSFEQRRDFLGRILYINNKESFDNRLSLIDIKSIDFNKNLNQAIVNYNFTYRGAIEKYEKTNGIWKKTETLLNWIE
jgi:hypothetical protein